MDDAQTLSQLKSEMEKIKERLTAIEKEQRKILEDILSGEPKERMHKRLLDKPGKKMSDKKEKIDDQIKIQI